MALTSGRALARTSLAMEGTSSSVAAVEIFRSFAPRSASWSSDTLGRNQDRASRRAIWVAGFVDGLNRRVDVAAGSLSTRGPIEHHVIHDCAALDARS